MANDKLKQTRNSFKLVGKVTRLDKDGAFREEVATKGKNEGKTYRALRFGVKTSHTNEIMVEMFDFEPEKVFLWNSQKKKEDKQYKGDTVPFEYWLENQDELREQGYAVLQTRVGFDYDDDGKLISHGLPSYVASEYIYENLHNGDSVLVEGEIRYGSYENREGKKVEKKQYIIKKLIRLKNVVDFDAENFEEVTYFEQEMVFVGADMDKKEKKVYVTGRVIDYMKNFHDTQMVIDFSDGEGGEDKDMAKLAEAFAKKFKFGDVINVFGDTWNRVIVEEVEGEENEEDDLLASLGGKRKPKHAQGYTARTYITEMRINGVDAWEKGVYTEQDFQKDDLFADDEDSLSKELGGKSKPKKKNPFDLGDDDLDDDLPF